MTEPSNDVRTPADWLCTPEFVGIQILDPDGWREEGADWDRPISREEFVTRLGRCTQSGWSADIPTGIWMAFPDARDWEKAGDRRYRGTSTQTDSWVVVAVDPGTGRYLFDYISFERAASAPFDIQGRTFERMEHAFAEAALPECVVPDCTDKGRVVYQAAEEIRLCPAHSRDVELAQHVYGMDQLAEWLRPDARPNPMDAFDAEMDTLTGGDTIRQASARALRIMPRTGPPAGPPYQKLPESLRPPQGDRAAGTPAR